jgi:hypothetical protein
MKGDSTMKKIFLVLCLIIIVSAACDVSVNIAPTNQVSTATATPIPLIDPPTPTPEVFIALTQAIPATAVPTVAQPVEVSVDPLTISLPPALASGARGIQVPRADGQDLPYWELTPGHTQLKLEGYPLQGKFHEPQIYVYPALEYAQLVPGAFESMHRLRNVMNAPGSTSVDQYPAVPFFNAAQVFASNFQTLSFQNGDGVRFLTEYAQYPAPVNNHELVYHYQGFSSDGEYYIVAILPITAPVLAETSDAAAAIPSGGVPYPLMTDPEANMPSYYASVTDLLNATPQDAFTPTINQLDALIQSMRITP